MSLIFDNYKYNEKYKSNISDNYNSNRDLKNYEKQRRRLIENSINGMIINNKNSNPTPTIPKNDYLHNDYSAPRSPYINKNENYINNSTK